MQKLFQNRNVSNGNAQIESLNNLWKLPSALPNWLHGAALAAIVGASRNGSQADDDRLAKINKNLEP